jgi:hypothetical protein
VIDAAKFRADTHRSIRKAALMLCGTDPRHQERWLLDHAGALRKSWRRQFDTLTAAQVDAMVSNTIRDMAKRTADLESHGVGTA